MIALGQNDQDEWERLAAAATRMDIEEWLNELHGGHAADFEWDEETESLPLVMFMVNGRDTCRISMSDPPVWLVIRMFLTRIQSGEFDGLAARQASTFVAEFAARQASTFGTRMES